jgi:hypothetical protein
MKRAVLLSVLGFLAAACGSDTTAPSVNVLTGTWGGAGVSLTADRSTVHAVFECDAADFSAPLRLNQSGEFVLPGTASRVSGSVQIGARGVVSGDTVTIEVIRWYPGGSSSREFTAVRDQPAILTALCAVPASSSARGAH